MLHLSTFTSGGVVIAKSLPNRARPASGQALLCLTYLLWGQLLSAGTSHVTASGLRLVLRGSCWGSEVKLVATGDGCLPAWSSVFFTEMTKEMFNHRR